MKGPVAGIMFLVFGLAILTYVAFALRAGKIKWAGTVRAERRADEPFQFWLSIISAGLCGLIGVAMGIFVLTR